MVHVKNVYSLRTQLATARWGKGARHPLCQAAMSLWSQEKELREIWNDIALLKVDPNSAELRRIKEQHWLFVYDKLYMAARAWFEIQFDAANIQEFRAYKRLEKQWHNGSSDAQLTERRKRVVGILERLRDKVINAAGATGGNAAYTEAAFGGDRLLSDEVWQERLTASEIHSHLVNTGVFNGNGAKTRELHEIRQDVKKLGIRLAPDRRGPKHKPPHLLKPKNGQPPSGLPVGRPRERFDAIKVADTDIIQAVERKKDHGIRPQAQTGATKRFWSHGLWDKREELKTKILYPVVFYPCPPGTDWRTWRKSYEPEPEPKGRSSIFKAWMASLVKVRYPRWMVLRMEELECWQLSQSVTRSRGDNSDNLKGGPVWKACGKMSDKSEARVVFAAAEREAAKEAQQRNASEEAKIKASLVKDLKKP